MEDMHAFFRSRRLLLAPMAGVSDEAFRTLCREQGADLTYTEMVSAKGLSYANEKTRHLLRLAPGEDQVAVQLFGHEPDTMAAQAAWIEREMGQSLAYLDINMGCRPERSCRRARLGAHEAIRRWPPIVRAVRAGEPPCHGEFRRGGPRATKPPSSSEDGGRGRRRP
ncbi:MAG: tRNA-dihydrouridine synthase [Eggerthella lenta]